MKIFLQTGQVYIPMNADTVLLDYSYLFKTETYDKNKASITVVWFKIVNGQLQFVATNPNTEIYMTRDDIRKYK
jgi:hypothetical protein